jgi:two-component system response regulator PilR (NtrC family)
MQDLNFLQENLKQEEPLLFSERPKVFIVEDDKMLGVSLQKYLSRTLNTAVFLFSSAEELLKELQNLEKSDAFCLITDISLESGSDGLWLIDHLREKNFKFVAIAMTGFASIETAILATKKGAYHYLTKPFELENLKKLVLEAIANKLNIKLETKEDDKINSARSFSKITLDLPKSDDIFMGMIGRSQKMKEVFERIRKVALSDSTVLITGASGTGKELVAQAIHNLSDRKNAPRVSVNCGAIPSELLESELFGHLKGSFTGAISNRKGRFELANNGSIFLDEIGDMPTLLQVKLLRVLQNRQIELVGSSQSMDINVRVIAATHRDLEKAVAEGKFREDLFYRLNVIPVKVPSLKERKEDIPLLISYFINKFVSADRSNEITFTDECLQTLISYDWPGNVRELENLIERLVILRGGNQIQVEDLPAKVFRSNPLIGNNVQTLFELPENGVDLKRILSDIEDSLILQALNKTHGNKNQASKLLSLNRTTLIEKLKKKSLFDGHISDQI